jgi:hypothetical protein
MVSKKALIGIGLALIIIGFGSVVLIEANRLDVPLVNALVTVIGVSTGQGICDTFSCHALGTEIENSCEIGDSTRTCTYQVNIPDISRSITVEENEIRWIVKGTDVECFVQSGGFGEPIENPLLLCRDEVRFAKNIWERADTDIGTDLFITFKVIGDQTYSERIDFLCPEGGFPSSSDICFFAIP